MTEKKTHVDRHDAHARLDKWLDDVERTGPRAGDGESMSISFRTADETDSNTYLSVTTKCTEFPV